MGNPVELTVKSQLMQITGELKKIAEQTEKVQEAFEGMGDEVSDNVKKNTDETKTFLEKLRGHGQRIAKQLRGDFRSLFSLNAIQESLKLSEQFKGSIKESVNLGNTIRKLGASFGIASKDFQSFQNRMIKGLGEIGMSSDAAARVMEGLVDTPVRGQEAILGYSKAAGQLSSISGEEGREGDIARGIANVIRAKGGDVESSDELARVAEDLRRAFVATGQGPTETLKAMEGIFSGMSQDLRKTFSTRGLATIAAGGQAAGPNSTKFIEEFLGKSPIARKALEAQGFGGVFTDEGIDIDKFRKAAGGVMSRVGGDPRLAAQTLGLTEDAAEGFVRLYENLDKVATAQERVQKATGSLAEQYRESAGFGEAFERNINRVKKVLAAPLSFISQKGAGLLTKASESDSGAAATVLGGGALAAILAGGGLKGVGKGLGIGGVAKGLATEQLTGGAVQPVYVTNASEIGGSLNSALGGLGGGGKLGGLMRGAGGAALAGGLGYAAGSLVEPGVTGFLNEKTTGTTSEGFKGNALERLFFKMDKFFGGEASSKHMRAQKVIVETNKQELKVSKQPNRGSSH